MANINDAFKTIKPAGGRLPCPGCSGSGSGGVTQIAGHETEESTVQSIKKKHEDFAKKGVRPFLSMKQELWAMGLGPDPDAEMSKEHIKSVLRKAERLLHLNKDDAKIAIKGIKKFVISLPPEAQWTADELSDMRQYVKALAGGQMTFYGFHRRPEAKV